VRGQAPGLIGHGRAGFTIVPGDAVRAEAQGLAIEGQLRFKAGDDRFGLAEPVPLPGERQMHMRNVVLGQFTGQDLGVLGHDDRVLQAMQQQHRAGPRGYVPTG
jgi:hypothetical protein